MIVRLVLTETEARNMVRDREVNQALTQQGWLVLRFWEHEILGDLESCVARVQTEWARRREGVQGA